MPGLTLNDLKPGELFEAATPSGHGTRGVALDGAFGGDLEVVWCQGGVRRWAPGATPVRRLEWPADARPRSDAAEPAEWPCDLCGRAQEAGTAGVIACACPACVGSCGRGQAAEALLRRLVEAYDRLEKDDNYTVESYDEETWRIAEEARKLLEGGP